MKNVTIEHNESGEKFVLMIQDNIHPVCLFTDFQSSHTNLLFIAKQDITTGEYEPDMKQGLPYYVSVADIDEDTEGTNEPKAVTIQDIKTIEDAEEHSEWIETMMRLTLAELIR